MPNWTAEYPEVARELGLTPESEPAAILLTLTTFATKALRAKARTIELLKESKGYAVTAHEDGVQETCGEILRVLDA